MPIRGKTRVRLFLDLFTWLTCAFRLVGRDVVISFDCNKYRGFVIRKNEICDKKITADIIVDPFNRNKTTVTWKLADPNDLLDRASTVKCILPKGHKGSHKGHYDGLNI